MNDALLRVLQLTDSAFPTGSFSQSFGLETAIAEGRVKDEVSFANWLRVYLEDGLGPADASAIVLAMRGAVTLGAIDDVLFALTPARESRQALTRIARAMRDGYNAIGIDGPLLLAYRTATDAGRAAGHPALWTAAAMNVMNVDAGLAAGAYLSNVLASLAAVAARAVPLGQRSVQRVLWEMRPAIAAAVEAALLVRSLEDIGSWATTQEIDAMRHHLLDARVFSS